MSRTAALALVVLPLALLPLLPVAKPPEPPVPTVTLTNPAARDQDDLCVWVHPTNPADSTVIVSDKGASKLFVYGLDGTLLQAVDAKHPGNIDLRTGFPLGEKTTDIVAVNLRDDRKLAVYAVDPESRKLTRVDDGAIATGENYGGCLYKSAKTGKFFAFTTSYGKTVAQIELASDGKGKVSGKKVRSWKVTGVCEAAVADDAEGKVYVSEETAGVWEVGAEPDAATPGTLVIKVKENGLAGDVEGLALVALPEGKGYLFVSDQGKNTFRVYRREGKHEYVGAFAVKGAADTDGIEIAATDLGAKFPQGLFACHTAAKSPCPVLLVPLDAIAKTFDPPLTLPKR